MKLKDIATKVTESIIESIENGTFDEWKKSWVYNMPKSAISGKPYKGINSIWLSIVADSKGYTSPYWFTYNQARKSGGSV